MTQPTAKAPNLMDPYADMGRAWSRVLTRPFGDPQHVWIEHIHAVFYMSKEDNAEVRPVCYQCLNAIEIAYGDVLPQASVYVNEVYADPASPNRVSYRCRDPRKNEGGAPLMSGQRCVEVEWDSYASKPHEQYFDVRKHWSVKFQQRKHGKQLIVSIASSAFWQVDGDKRSLEYIDSIIKLTLARCKVVYAFFDCTTFHEDYGGHLYSGMIAGRQRNVIEELCWTSVGDQRQNRVRGLYWGQWLNATHLSKVGGKQQFVADVVKMDPEQGRMYLREFDRDGLFIQFSTSPLHWGLAGSGITSPQASFWFFERLRDAGMLS